MSLWIEMMDHRIFIIVVDFFSSYLLHPFGFCANDHFGPPPPFGFLRRPLLRFRDDDVDDDEDDDDDDDDDAGDEKALPFIIFATSSSVSFDRKYTFGLKG